MNAQLMAAARFGHQAHAGFAIFGAHDAPVCLRGLACVVADHLLGPVRPIHDEWQVNGAGFIGHFTPDTGDIGLFGLPLFELQAKVALRVGGQRKNHHAGRVAIKAMHQQGGGKDGLDTGDKAIGQMKSSASAGKHPDF